MLSEQKINFDGFIDFTKLDFYLKDGLI